MNIPSIFNDVIGPVMRGPSSSHSAAAVRIGLIGRELMGGRLEQVTVRFDLGGSLPTTYISQGSDLGLGGGLLGFSPDDERLINFAHELEAAGIRVSYIHDHLGDPHPNTYNLTLKNSKEEHNLTALSIGGGMMEVIQIDGLTVSYFGDCYGLIVWTGAGNQQVIDLLMDAGCTVASSESDPPLIFATRSTPFDDELLNSVNTQASPATTRLLTPVLPVLTTDHSHVPFSNAAELARYANETGVNDLADLGIHYEAARGEISHDQVMENGLHLVNILENSIHKGLEGTEYADRILGYQSGRYKERLEHRKLLDLGLLDRAIPYITALMEVKSAMGVIVAAPTAGSCGGLPGTVMAVGDALDLTPEAKARGLLAGGIIGALIATRSTFSAEVCGCQAECGVSSGMIAAAIVSMAGGDYTTSLSAASMALQNIFGMVCDPVANRVEVPCLGKNIMAASNGLAMANLALAGFDQVIPFDEVVLAMDSVGRAIPHELRCTALGGLSLTPTSEMIKKQLES